MVGGFNHNFCYKEQTYHVQTEDSGVKKAQITSLLYKGGTILARTTTSYAEIMEVTDLAVQVEIRMKEQHKKMLYDLKAGCYDSQIANLAVHADGIAGEQQQSEAVSPVAEAAKTESARRVEAQQPTAVNCQPARVRPAVADKKIVPAAADPELAQLVRAYLSAARQ